MTEEDIVKQLLPLRAQVLEHAKAQTALPTPRKTRLAIEALGVSIRALKTRLSLMIGKKPTSSYVVTDD